MIKEKKKTPLTTITVTTTTPSLLTVPETAKYFRVSRRTIDKLIHELKLGHMKIGRRVLIPTTAINEYLSENYKPPFDAAGHARKIIEGRMKLGR